MRIFAAPVCADYARVSFVGTVQVWRAWGTYYICCRVGEAVWYYPSRDGPTAPSSPTSIAKERRRPQSTKFTDLSESSISDCSLVPRPFFATQGKKVWERD